LHCALGAFLLTGACNSFDSSIPESDKLLISNLSCSGLQAFERDYLKAKDIFLTFALKIIAFSN